MISKPSALPRDIRSLGRMVIEKKALLGRARAEAGGTRQ